MSKIDCPDTASAGVGAELYQPGNGAEGRAFMTQWCERCERDAAFQRDPDHNDGCEIVAYTMILDVDDSDYPREWCWLEGRPVCTAFQALVRLRGEAQQEPDHANC